MTDATLSKEHENWQVGAWCSYSIVVIEHPVIEHPNVGTRQAYQHPSLMILGAELNTHTEHSTLSVRLHTQEASSALTKRKVLPAYRDRPWRIYDLQITKVCRLAAHGYAPLQASAFRSRE